MEIVQKAMENLKGARENLENSTRLYREAKTLLRKSIGAEYPLLSLTGRDYIYSRALWGSPKNGVTDADFLSHYTYMEPYSVVVGSDDDNFMGLEVGATYVHFILLEQDSSWDDENPEFWESMFIKIS